MQKAVGIIATIATVIHFTFGCCLHPCHGSAHPASLSPTAHASSCGDCCHGPGNVSGQVETAADQQETTGLVVAGNAAEPHGCAGCHCAATPVEHGGGFGWLFASGIVAAFASGPIRPTATGGAGQPPAKSLLPDRRALRTSERLLI